MNDMNKPLVSVIVPTYNCGPFVAEALDSIVGQTFRPLEIVVADDGLEFHFDAELIEFFGEPETVGISAIGREELGRDRDDFCCQRFKQARLADA